jgi:stearoyl-CoA desaturase (Delta-9 desaturase)
MALPLNPMPSEHIPASSAAFLEAGEPLTQDVSIPDLSIPAAENIPSAHGLANLDRKLAWVVTVMPAVAFVVALALHFTVLPAGRVELLLVAIFYILGLIGVEVGFHRHFTHRSFKAATWVRVTLAILGSMAFEGPVIWWAATHRRHHKYSDIEGDPHSPNLFGAGRWAKMRGLLHAHMGWLFLPQSTRAPGWGRYAADLYRDRAIFRVHMLYFYWLVGGILLPGIIGGLWAWSWKGFVLGVLWGGLVRIFLMNHVFYWCINSVTHAFGTRPFRTTDKSTNNVWLVLPTLGQSWHNNHHAFPTSARMGFYWWQIDPGTWIIWGLQKLGLVWDVNVPDRSKIEKKRQEARDLPAPIATPAAGSNQGKTHETP